MIRTLVLLLVVASGSFAQLPDRGKEVCLVPGVETIKAGTPFTVALVLDIKPGWHVYWRNPGSVGIPTQVRWDLPAGFTASPLRFPTPRRFTSAGIAGYGYEGKTVFLVDFEAPARVETERVVLKGRAAWLACDAWNCKPGRAEIELTLPVGDEVRLHRPGLRIIKEVTPKMPVAVDWPVSASFSADRKGIKLTIAHGGNVASTDGLECFVENRGLVDLKRGQQFNFEQGHLTVVLPPAESFDHDEGLPEVIRMVLESREGFRDRTLGTAVELTGGDRAQSP